MSQHACRPYHSELLQDWPNHCKTCAPAQTITNNSLPNGSSHIFVSPSPTKNQRNAVSALLFSPEEGELGVSALIYLWQLSESPRVILVDLLPQCPPSPNTRPRLAVSEYFHNEEPDEIIVYNGLCGKSLRFPLQILVSRNAGNKSAPVNRAISNITSSVSLWYGVVLVFRFSGTRKLDYSNASENDLPNIFAYFIEHRHCWKFRSVHYLSWLLVHREGSLSHEIVDLSYVIHARSCFFGHL